MPPKADPYATKLHKRIDALLFLLTVLIIAIVLRTSARGQGILPQVISVAPQPFWSTLSLFHVEPKLSLAMREPALAIDSQLDYTAASGADFSALAGLSENSSTEFSPILMVQEKASALVAPAMLEPDNAHRSFGSSSPGLANNWSQTAGIGTTIPAVITGFGKTTGNTSEAVLNSQENQAIASANGYTQRYAGESNTAPLTTSAAALLIPEGFSGDRSAASSGSPYTVRAGTSDTNTALTEGGVANPKYELSPRSTLDVSARNAIAATRYWDTTAGLGNGVGGSATWSAQTDTRFSTTATGDATLTSAAMTDAGIFQGTAGTITFGFSPTLASWTFNTTNYKLTSTSSVNRTLTGSFTLANNVNLIIGNGETTDIFITLAGTFSGGTGAGITINGSATGGAVTRLGFAQSGIDINVPVTITGTGFASISSSSSATVSGTVTGNGSRLNLGSTNVTGLTFTNAINNGTGTVRIAAGPSGGAGRVTISSTGNTWGDTELNNTASGILRLGISNALPTGTTLRFGTTTGNGASMFDLSGYNQTIGQLTSGAESGGTIRMTTSVGGASSKLTISGSDVAQPAFSGIIENGVGTVSLERAGTGTTTLTGVSTYTGGTTVSGGMLVLGNATNTLSNTGAVSVSGGTLSIGTNSDTVGAVNLTSGSITGSTGTLTGSNYAVQSGSVSAKLGGTASLTKTTSGTVTLSGANTFIGSTTIAANGGTLVAATGSLVSTSSVTVNSGGTLLLSGNGRHLGNATGVKLQGGTFDTGGFSEPGGTLGSQNIGALTLTSTSTIDFGAGNLSVLEFAGVGTHIASTMLQIINWDGIPVVGGSGDRLLFNGLATTFIGAYNQSDVSFNGLSGYLAVQFDPFGPNPYFEITSLTPVPEPSTWAAAALALGAIAWTHFRKRAAPLNLHP